MPAHDHRPEPEDPTGAAAFFDIDKTVVAKPALVAFARPLYDAGMIDTRLVVQAAWQHLRFQLCRPGPARMVRVRAEGLRIITGWDAAEVRRVVERSLPDVLAPAVYDGAVARIRQHQRRGEPVWLVSAEPVEIVEPLGAFLGVDGTIASEALVDGSGRYTGTSRTWIYGPSKADAIGEVARRHRIDLAASFAYSDSSTDLPMLEAVGHPHCVNPDRALARVARDRGWTTLRFTRGRRRAAAVDAGPGAAVTRPALDPAS